MASFLSKNSTQTNFLNFLFVLIPLSFIAGNLILNLNILFFIIFSIVFYGKGIFEIKLNSLDKLILLFFSFLLFTGILNHFQNLDESSNSFMIITKTIFFFRYFFLYFVIRYLVLNEIINFKFFFISSAIFSLLVSLDLFYQFYSGQDIFGNLPVGRKFSGPFGDELIAGGYIQRFSLFSFFLLPFFFKSKKNINLIIPLLFIVYLGAMLISGNRMPVILFLFIMTLIILLEKQTRKYLITFLVTLSIILILLFNLSSKVKNDFTNFYSTISKLTMALSSKKIDRSVMPDHYAEFETFYDTWLMNKYIGGGVRSFRINCPNRQNIDLDERSTCNTHPHNYYLEILTDLGLIGFFILSAIFLQIFYISFLRKYFLSSNLKDNQLITPFIFLFLAEIFPIKSSGSFFTTGNAVFIFLVLSIIAALARQKNSI